MLYHIVASETLSGKRHLVLWIDLQDSRHCSVEKDECFLLLPAEEKSPEKLVLKLIVMWKGKIS